MKEAPVIVALDGLLWPNALRIAESLKGKVWGFKLHDLYEEEIRKGNDIIPILKQFGKVFLDLKFHDIPATVGKRVKVYAGSGVDIMTIHAPGGVEMIKEAVKNRGQANIAAVTVLTSIGEAEAVRIYGKNPEEKVPEFAEMALEGGAQMIVCSPKELSILKKDERFKKLKKIVPGIRPAGAATNDQNRVGTPEQALADDASLLVIGRPLTEPADPLSALKVMFPSLE